MPATYGQLLKTVSAFPKPLIKKIRKFDPEGTGYDYKTSQRAGLKRNKAGHLGSLDPRTGMVLKGKKHPTWNLMEAEEKRRGSKVVKKSGRYFSVPALKRKK